VPVMPRIAIGRLGTKHRINDRSRRYHNDNCPRDHD
jgi:hypothetical protein